MRPDRRAYLASPIIAAGENLLGVLYMDTNRPGDFQAQPPQPPDRGEALILRIESLAPFFCQLLLLKGG